MAIICEGCGQEIESGSIFITGEADVKDGVIIVSPDLVTTYHPDCVE